MGVDDQGHIITVMHSLGLDSITLAPGYDAMKEDPDIYKTIDFCRYSAPRHFPEMALQVSGIQYSSNSNLHLVAGPLHQLLDPSFLTN